MKKLMFMLLLAGSIQAMYAQKFSPNTPLFEELTDVKKKTDKFNLYLNMQGSFDAHFQNGFQEGDFNMHQLRIEAKGNINNWLSYRYRQRLNRSNDGNNMISRPPSTGQVSVSSSTISSTCLPVNKVPTMAASSLTSTRSMSINIVI